MTQPTIGPLKASVLYGGTAHAKDDPLHQLALEAARRGQAVALNVIYRDNQWWLDVQIDAPAEA